MTTRPKGKPVVVHGCCNPPWPLVVRQKDGHLYASGMKAAHADATGTAGQCRQCGQWVKAGAFSVLDSLRVPLLLPR